MWLFITTSDRYDRAFSLIGGHVYLNYEEDDAGNENRQRPFIELAFPARSFTLKFEPSHSAEQFYQRLKSAIKIGRTQLDTTEEGFVISELDDEPTELQVNPFEDALPVRQVR